MPYLGPTRKPSVVNSEKLHIGYDFLYTNNDTEYAPFFLSRRSDPNYILFMQVLRTLDMKKDLVSEGPMPTDKTGKTKLNAYNIAIIMAYGTEVADIASRIHLDSFFETWIKFLSPEDGGGPETSPIALKFGLEYAPIVEETGIINTQTGLDDGDKEEMHIVYQEAGISPHKVFKAPANITTFECDAFIKSQPEYLNKMRIGLNIGCERFDSLDRSPQLEQYAPLHYEGLGSYFELTKDYYRCYGFNGCRLVAGTVGITTTGKNAGKGTYDLYLELDDVEGVDLEEYNQGNRANHYSISKCLKLQILSALIQEINTGNHVPDKINSVVSKIRFYFQTKAQGDANQSFMSDEHIDYIKQAWASIKYTMVTCDRTVIITNTSMRRNSTYFFEHKAKKITFIDEPSLTGVRTAVTNTAKLLKKTKKTIDLKVKMLIGSKNIVDGRHILLTDTRIKGETTGQRSLRDLMTILSPVVLDQIEQVVIQLETLKKRITTQLGKRNAENETDATKIATAKSELENYRLILEGNPVYKSFLELEVSKKKKGKTRKYSIMWMKSTIWLDEHYVALNTAAVAVAGAKTGGGLATGPRTLTSRAPRKVNLQQRNLLFSKARQAQQAQQAQKAQQAQQARAAKLEVRMEARREAQEEEDRYREQQERWYAEREAAQRYAEREQQEWERREQEREAWEARQAQQAQQAENPVDLDQYVANILGNKNYNIEQFLEASVNRAKLILDHITSENTIKEDFSLQNIGQNQLYDFAEKNIITLNDFFLVSKIVLNMIYSLEETIIEPTEPNIGGRTFSDNRTITTAPGGIEVIIRNGQFETLDMHEQSPHNNKYIFELILEKALYLQETINILKTGVIETYTAYRRAEAAAATYSSAAAHARMGAAMGTFSEMTLECADIIWEYPLPIQQEAVGLTPEQHQQQQQYAQQQQQEQQWQQWLHYHYHHDHDHDHQRHTHYTHHPPHPPSGTASQQLQHLYAQQDFGHMGLGKDGHHPEAHLARFYNQQMKRHGGGVIKTVNKIPKQKRCGNKEAKTPKHNKTKHSKPKNNKTKHSKPKHNRTKHNKTKHSKPKRNKTKTKHSKPKHNKTKHRKKKCKSKRRSKK